MIRFYCIYSFMIRFSPSALIRNSPTGCGGYPKALFQRCCMHLRLRFCSSRCTLTCQPRMTPVRRLKAIPNSQSSKMQKKNPARGRTPLRKPASDAVFTCPPPRPSASPPPMLCSPVHLHALAQARPRCCAHLSTSTP
jgi:hypothetical protein